MGQNQGQPGKIPQILQRCTSYLGDIINHFSGTHAHTNALSERGGQGGGLVQDADREKTGEVS